MHKKEMWLNAQKEICGSIVNNMYFEYHCFGNVNRNAFTYFFENSLLLKLR